MKGVRSAVLAGLVTSCRFMSPTSSAWTFRQTRQEKGGNKRMVRDNKGKPPKGAKKSPDAHTLKSTSEEQLLSKLQEESLKVHGDPLDPKKKRAETEEQR